MSDDLIYSNRKAWDAENEVWYPLTWKAVAAEQAERLKALEKWALICSDLDRCEHGRHEGDICSGLRYGCGGPSHGNLLVGHAPIGHGMNGAHIFSPPRSTRADPDEWRVGGRCNSDGQPCPINPAPNRQGK